MKKLLVLFAFSLILTLCLTACQTDTEQPADETTTAQQTEATTEEMTSEEITTAEETTTEEITTEPAKVEVQHPSAEQVKAAAVTFLDAAAMKKAADNPQQDWSDFGGLTENEDGSVTALFRMGTNDVWDPYCYLLKEDTTVGDIMVIKYQVKYDFRVRLYMATEGNAATGAGDLVTTEIFATEEGEWAYLIVNLADEAGAYDPSAAALGYIRIGLDMAESGDTLTIGYIAFFTSMNEVNDLIPY